jgi:tetratricopeptide (TPR) repeat protein
MKAYENEDFETAIPLLREAVELTTDDPLRERLQIKCALALDAVNRHHEALELLHEVLRRNPESAAAWNDLGIICRHMEKYDEARAAFERAYKLKPDQADPLINLGSVCLVQGDPGNALQYLQLALEMLPGHQAVHANLALTYAVFGRLEEAEDSLRLAVLYGFDQAAVIEEKIAALKKVRDDMFVNLEKRRAETAGSSDKEALMTAGASSSDDGEDAYEAPPAAAEEMDLLVQLEIEMHSLAERRYGVESGMDHEELVRTVSRMNSLRIQIVLLRLGLGMDAVTDSDVVNGVNYMEDDTGSMG